MQAGERYVKRTGKPIRIQNREIVRNLVIHRSASATTDEFSNTHTDLFPDPHLKCGSTVGACTTSWQTTGYFLLSVIPLAREIRSIGVTRLRVDVVASNLYPVSPLSIPLPAWHMELSLTCPSRIVRFTKSSFLQNNDSPAMSRWVVNS